MAQNEPLAASSNKNPRTLLAEMQLGQPFPLHGMVSAECARSRDRVSLPVTNFALRLFSLERERRRPGRAGARQVPGVWNRLASPMPAAYTDDFHKPLA